MKSTAVEILLCLAIFITLVAADSHEYSYAPSARSERLDDANYGFRWAVNGVDSGNNYGHEETRDGDVTQGSYYVMLPDGRRQVVTYRSDPVLGYTADVSYSGEARYPEARSAPRTRASSGLAPKTRVSSGFAPQTRVSSGFAPQTRVSSGFAPQTRVSSGFAPQTRASSGVTNSAFRSLGTVPQATRSASVSPSATPTGARIFIHHDSLESVERFPSFEFDSLEQFRAFNVPKNPFLHDSNESF